LLRLSDDFFDECLLSVYEDLEEFNQELASNLINNEFDASHDDNKDVAHNVELNESVSQISRVNSSPGSPNKSPIRRNLSQKNPNLQALASANTTYSSFESNNDSFTTISN
jgi:hypothetical protein